MYRLLCNKVELNPINSASLTEKDADTCVKGPATQRIELSQAREIGEIKANYSSMGSKLAFVKSKSDLDVDSHNLLLLQDLKQYLAPKEHSLLDDVISNYALMQKTGSTSFIPYLNKQLAKLNQGITENFLDPADDLAMNDDLDQVNSNLKDFSKELRRINLAHKINYFYHVPNTLDLQTQSLRLSSSDFHNKNLNSNFVRVAGQLETEKIFAQSFSLHGLDSKLNRSERMKQAEKNRLSFLNQGRLPALLKEQLAFDSETKKFQPRQTGFHDAARMFFALQKNYEPETYALTIALAKNLASQGKPVAQTKILIPLAVHQSEERLSSHFLKALSEQDFEQKNMAVYLFLNGDDEKLLQQRIDEISLFQKNNPEMNINTIVASPSEWGMGLKSIPHNVAIATELLRKNLGDADLATHFFDADVLSLEPSTGLQESCNTVAQKGGIFFDAFLQDDYEHMKEQNINYGLIEKISHHYIYPRQEDFSRYPEKKSKEGLESCGTCGGNSMYSTLALMITGGIKPYAVHEDMENVQSMQELMRSLSLHHREEIEAAGAYGQLSLKSMMDGGAIIRAIDRDMPGKEEFNSHEHNSTTKKFFLKSIDKLQPKLVNEKRITQELKYCLEKFIAASSLYFIEAKGSEPVTCWDPSFNNWFKKEVEAYAEKINKTLRTETDIAFSSGKESELSLYVNFHTEDFPIVDIKFGDQQITANPKALILGAINEAQKHSS